MKDHLFTATKPESPPSILYHGTSRKAWEKIKLEGLRPMNRQYVHLSSDRDTAMTAGRMHDENPVIIAVYAWSAWLGGSAKFYRSADDRTWMSEPISAKYIRELRPLSREYVEEVENKIVELERGEYAGHELDTKFFDEKKDILLLLSLASEERVKSILKLFKSFPNGLWRERQYPNIDKYINIVDRMENGRNFDNLTGKVSLKWYSGNGKTFGYGFTSGSDDGYPETTTIGIPSELLYLDDDALKRRIASEVIGAMEYTKSQLEKELAEASIVLKEAEKRNNHEK